MTPGLQIMETNLYPPPRVLIGIKGSKESKETSHLGQSEVTANENAVLMT